MNRPNASATGVGEAFELVADGEYSAAREMTTCRARMTSRTPCCHGDVDSEQNRRWADGCALHDASRFAPFSGLSAFQYRSSGGVNAGFMAWLARRAGIL